MTSNRPLTQRQLDGLACVLCGRDDPDFLASSLPAGTVGSHQLFRCQHCDDDAAYAQAVLRAKAIFADRRHVDGK